MQLTGCGALLGTVGLSVDHEAAGATDSFTTIAVERDGLVAISDEVLVDEVEHLEKGHLVLHICCFVGLEVAGVGRTALAPDLECEIHNGSWLLVTALDGLNGFKHERLFVEGRGCSRTFPFPCADE